MKTPRNVPQYPMPKGKWDTEEYRVPTVEELSKRYLDHLDARDPNSLDENYTGQRAMVLLMRYVNLTRRKIVQVLQEKEPEAGWHFRPGKSNFPNTIQQQNRLLELTQKLKKDSEWDTIKQRLDARGLKSYRLRYEMLKHVFRMSQKVRENKRDWTGTDGMDRYHKECYRVSFGKKGSEMGLRERVVCNNFLTKAERSELGWDKVLLTYKTDTPEMKRLHATLEKNIQNEDWQLAHYGITGLMLFYKEMGKPMGFSLFVQESRKKMKVAQVDLRWPLVGVQYDSLEEGVVKLRELEQNKELQQKYNTLDGQIQFLKDYNIKVAPQYFWAIISASLKKKMNKWFKMQISLRDYEKVTDEWVTQQFDLFFRQLQEKGKQKWQLFDHTKRTNKSKTNTKGFPNKLYYSLLAKYRAPEATNDKKSTTLDLVKVMTLLPDWVLRANPPFQFAGQWGTGAMQTTGQDFGTSRFDSGEQFIAGVHDDKAYNPEAQLIAKEGGSEEEEEANKEYNEARRATMKQLLGAAVAAFNDEEQARFAALVAQFTSNADEMTEQDQFELNQYFAKIKAFSEKT